MNHLDLLVPFGLPPAELARDLLRQCKAPALATLLSRGQSSAPRQRFDQFFRALPHEHWLGSQFGLSAAAPTGSDARGNSPAAAAALLQRHLPQQPGYWFVLQPAHIHVARDHLVLTDIGQLALAADDAQRLFQAAQALCEEIGHALHYVDANTWLLRADAWSDLLTSSPQAACGRNIDIWMPSGASARAWRKLQNEVQMQWVADDLNQQREQRGQKPVNSLWLWGGAASGSTPASPYQHSFNLRDWGQAVDSSTSQPAGGPAEVLAAPGTRALLQLDALLEAGLSAEWGLWLQALETLDQEWFAPLLQALRDKRLQRLTLVLSGADTLQQADITPAALRKFWVRPSLSLLAS